MQKVKMVYTGYVDDALDGKLEMAIQQLEKELPQPSNQDNDTWLFF